MNCKNIRRNLYRVLRKTGVPRERIAEDSSFSMDLMMDEIDMTCFLFYLETSFNVNIDNDALPRINSVPSTIDYLQQRCA
ncbi:MULTISPECIES: acyl carrier protein [Marinilabiliaceae]|uniref:Acyl carrier protein n=2 Tax=Marinilabiliaceae TaxID=558415 RepID=A0A1T5CIW8_9BACT|nr:MULTISPECIES: acyl carrier protein [Marinilabiliaceae]ASB49878.1 acyl carrier protein [Alkalitalea saponilacus]TCO09891.1 acyl carrier protein [Natronoflexus pectinivorans]SKB59293.1 acyl carrier protein [Alkalitalea saponilacus]